MKKRTVITTEKCEVWVITSNGATLETTDQPSGDSSTEEGQALSTIVPESPDNSSTGEPE